MLERPRGGVLAARPGGSPRLCSSVLAGESSPGSPRRSTWGESSPVLEGVLAGESSPVARASSPGSPPPSPESERLRKKWLTRRNQRPWITGRSFPKRAIDRPENGE